MSFSVDRLTPDSTLIDLPYHIFHVDCETLGQAVYDRFRADPTLPGVIVLKDDKLMGLVSQRRFLERMSQRFSLELYLKRPIRILPEISRDEEPLILSPTCRIDEAARLALARPQDLIYEPIIIRTRDGLALVDMYVILLGQSQIFASINSVLQQQRQEAEAYLHQLESEKERTQEYAHRLEREQAESQRANSLLKKRQIELQRQSQEIAELNQRFVQVSRLLSAEGKKAFEATFSGVTNICETTDKVALTSNTLAKDLESVDVATKLIEDISRQVKHLALQASLILSRSGSIPGFDYIINEIGNLGTQTFRASSQVQEIATRFKTRIQELSIAAKAGETTARSLAEQIQHAEIALKDLEDLVQKHNLNSSAKEALPPPPPLPRHLQDLVER